MNVEKTKERDERKGMRGTLNPGGCSLMIMMTMMMKIITL
jgi:hypothetical protein